MTEQAESPERSYFRSTMIGDVDILELNSKTIIKAGTMSDIKDTEVISPPAKRMKQARLPFVSLTNKQILSSDPSSQITKKPKLTDKSSPFFSSSGKARHVDKNTTPIKKADTPQAKKSGAMKVRKIGFSNEIAGKPCAPPEPEVSSSSEDTKPSEKECDSTVTMAGSSCTSTASPKKVSKSASLDRFIQSTQQPQVSTSAIIDLTDADDEMEDDDDFEPPKSLTKKSKAEKRKRESPTRSPAKSTTDATTEITETPQEGDAAVNTSVSSISSLEQTSSDEESSSEEEEEEKDSNRSISDGKDKEDTLMEAVEKVLEEEEKNTALDKNHEEKPIKMPPQPVTPSNVMKPVKKTPMSAKALQRLKEQEAKREEKQRQREEKKRKLEEENEVKKRQKLEQRRAKEEEKEAQRKQKVEEKKKKEMEKQLKKEKEEQERMEKKKAKEEERQKKQEEIEAKQEEKKKRQEERQKLEEEKKQKEEAELLKKAKQSQMFKSFFSVQTQAPVKKPEFKGWFAPFEVKTDMVLAPCSRVDPKDLDLKQVDKHLETPSTGSLYLDKLKSGRFKPRRNGRTPGPARPAQESMDIDAPSTSAEDSKKKSKLKKPEGIKMKLLQFHENYRPAYYGTWQKKTSVITGRNPFKKDEDTFDYEFDSDDEWEEPGESLSHSEGEDEDGDGDDDDDEEDGFFVPHGYLSAGEGGEDEEDTDNLKARQAAKARAWENELKRRCEALKPMIITFIQVASTNKTRQDEKKKLEAYQAMPLTNLPITTSFTKREKAKAGEESTNATQGEGGAAMAQQKLAGGVGNKLKPVPEEAMPELLRLVHGNMAGIKSLIHEFRDYWRCKQHRLETTSPRAVAACPDDSPSVASGDQGNPVTPRESPLGEARAAGTPVQNTSPSPVPGTTPSPQYLDHIDHKISKRQLDLKINSIAVRERRPQHFKRICWYVHDHILEKYNLTDLPVPTAWVNGVGVRDGQASPLPPTSIASKPAVAVPKPAVNKPVLSKVPSLHEGSTVSSLLKASKEQAALANQHIFIPSNNMPSAFNKVVGVSSASGTVHLPGATHFQSTPSIGYIPPESTLLRPGLAPFQLVPLQMQQTINPAAFNMSNLLQQAAASSLLANMQQTSALGSTLVQPPNTSGAQKTIPGVAKDIDSHYSKPQDLTGVKQRHSAPILKPTIRSPPPGGPKSTSSPPGRSSGSSGGVPLLPSVKKVSPQRLDTAIAKLYESNALLREKEKTNPAPAPVKKTKTIASFFNVGNPKKSENMSQEIPSETPKE